jgi:poly(3-hydroxybutyrate) depolymerase
MPFGLFVPRTYDAARKWPLLVALHGAGGDHNGVMRYTGLTELADQHGVIVVTPLGFNRFGGYGAYSRLRVCADSATAPPVCNAGVIGTIVRARRASPSNIDDLSERDVLNVVEMVRREFAVDSARMFLFGHSMGGGGAYHLAAKYPGMWAAVAVTAPWPSADSAQIERFKQVPTLVIHGDADGTVPVFGTRTTVAMMARLGARHEYVEVAGGDHTRLISRNRERLASVFEFFGRAVR